MLKRGWLLGVSGLILIGLLVACGTNYDSSSDGLLVVGSQGSSAIETFSFTLNNGHVATITNSPNDTGNETCILNGSPAGMVINPAGTYAFVIFNKSDICPNATQFGIATFKLNSDGTASQTGNLLVDPNPTSLAMDPAGKYLFVAEGVSTIAIANATAEGTACTQTPTQNGVCLYAIGSDGGLTSVPSTFTLPPTPMTPNFVAIAPTPTVFPPIGINGVQNSVCSVNNPPTSQFLYAVDAVNYLVWQFSVDPNTGALGNPGVGGQLNSFATDQVPLGIAVDPCDRFAYVSDSLTNKVSAYTICSGVISGGVCPNADGTLLPVVGSPFSLSGSNNGPGPLVVDPFGNNVYVLGTLSNVISGFKISPVSGGLTALNPPTVATGQRPVSIAIRADDNWMFVTNFNSATVSQYSITPATGALSVAAPIQTDNQPFGVAVK